MLGSAVVIAEALRCDAEVYLQRYLFVLAF